MRNGDIGIMYKLLKTCQINKNNTLQSNPTRTLSISYFHKFCSNCIHLHNEDTPHRYIIEHLELLNVKQKKCVKKVTLKGMEL